MAALAPAPASRLDRLFATVLVAGLVIVLAWQLAHWTWVFLSPPAGSAAVASRTAPDIAVASRLFGGSAPAAEVKSSSYANLHLKGVIAPTPGTVASAVFSTGSGKDIAVLLDRDIQPGVTLVSVEPDHVIVSRGGVRERIDLDVRMSAPSKTGAVQAPGFRVNVARPGTNAFSFSRKEFEGALRDPAQLNYLGKLGSPQGGGVRLDEAPPGSLANKLGLQPGDIIKKVNGQVVLSVGDLAQLYQQFATLSLIQADVQRGSATLQMSYTIRP
jgi:general secretion pathway protein C